MKLPKGSDSGFSLPQSESGQDGGQPSDLGAGFLVDGDDADDRDKNELESVHPSSQEPGDGQEVASRKKLHLAAVRVVIFMLALAPLILLGVARTLQPSDQGLGTHQQLGLPPCSMRLMMGFRCPACGMTTSWSHFTRGNFVQSMQSNAGGFLLALMVIASAPVLIRWAWTGRSPQYKVQNRLIYALVGVMGVTICDWITRIWAFS